MTNIKYKNVEYDYQHKTNVNSNERLICQTSNFTAQKSKETDGTIDHRLGQAHKKWCGQTNF